MGSDFWATVFTTAFFHVGVVSVLFGVCLGAIILAMLRAPANIVKMLSDD